jgi:hypothetical protein
MRMRMLGVEVGVSMSLGVLKAPVLWRCSFSKISWSSLGRRGGAGPDPKGACAWWVEVLKVRRESWRGRRAMVRIVAAMVGDCAGNWSANEGVCGMRDVARVMKAVGESMAKTTFLTVDLGRGLTEPIGALQWQRRSHFRRSQTCITAL